MLRIHVQEGLYRPFFRRLYYFRLLRTRILFWLSSKTEYLVSLVIVRESSRPEYNGDNRIPRDGLIKTRDTKS